MKKTVKEKWCGMRINFHSFWKFPLMHHKLLYNTKLLVICLKSDFYFTGLGEAWDSVFVRGSQEILMKLVTEIHIVEKCVKVQGSILMIARLKVLYLLSLLPRNYMQFMLYPPGEWCLLWKSYCQKSAIFIATVLN